MSHIRISRLFVLAALAVAVLIPVSASAHVGVGIGFYGPVVPWGWGLPYGPYGYYGPYGPYGYYGRPVGEVHIKGPDPNAQIFINGAFAGRAHDLKSSTLFRHVQHRTTHWQRCAEGTCLSSSPTAP